MKYILMDIEQTLIQGTSYYHGEEGIGDYTPCKEDAKLYSLEEIKKILVEFPNEKISLVPTMELESIYTVNEASNYWHITEGAIRASIKANKFIEGIDYRKAGRITLITREAMIRVYGEPKTK